MYILLGLTLTLSAFLAATVVTSLLVAAFADPVLRRVGAERPRRRSQVAFGLRVLPTALSGVVVAFLASSYLLLEPRNTAETPGLALVAMALAGMVLLAAGLSRALVSWDATQRAVTTWMREAVPVGLSGAPAVAYRVRDAFPVVSLVGTLHPRIFVANQVLESLSPGEVQAAVAHEAAHLRSRDNLKRLILRSCPDLLAFLPAGRRLEREWAQAAETVADLQAAGGDAARALELGAALLKVARLVSVAPRPAWSVSSLHDGAEVDARVRRLVGGPQALESSTPSLVLVGWLALSSLLLLLPAVVSGTNALNAIHQLTEAAVHFLG